jgi:hypothetical protein
VLLGVLVVELEVNLLQERLKDSNKKLNELEEMMGQHEYEDRPRGNVLDLDFLATTRRLNYISKKVGVDSVRTGSTLVTLEGLGKWKDEIISLRRDVDPAVSWFENPESESQRMIEEKLEYLRDSCRVMLLMADYEEKRVRTLIQVVRYPIPE